MPFLLIFNCFGSVFLIFVECFFGYFLELRISEYLHHAWAPARFSGFGWVWFCMFCVVFWGMVSGWFWEWIFYDFYVDLGSIFAPKIDKKVIDFGIDF